MVKKKTHKIFKRSFLIAVPFLLIIQLYGQSDLNKAAVEELNRSSVNLIDTDILGALDTNLAAWQQSKEIRNDTLTALIYSARGIIFTNLPNYDSAYFYIRKALFLRKIMNDIEGVGKSFTNLGTMFYESGHYELAKYYYQKSLRIKIDLNDQWRLPGAYNNIGNCCYYMTDIDSAVYYHKKGIDCSNGAPSKIIQNKINLSNIYIEQKQIEKSLLLLHEITPELDTSIYKGTCYHQMGIAYEKLGQYDSAQHYYDKTLQLTYVLENLTLEKDLSKSQIILNLKRTNDLEGLADFSQYNKLNDSLNTQKINSKIAEAEAKYNYVEATGLLKLEEEKNRRVEAEREQNILTIIVLISLIVVIIIMVAILFRFYSQKRKLANLELETKKHEIEQLIQGYELDLFEAQNFGQREERQRVATDLHDRLGGLLAAVNLQIESLNYSKKEDKTEELAKIKTMVSDGITEVRNISHDLRAEALKKHGLKGALQAICQSIIDSKKIKIDLYLDELDDTAGSELERETYKIIMELLSNTLKHAHANLITLQINEIDDELTVVYEDDGKGFSQEPMQSNGLGIQSIDERVKKLNGTWEVDSQLNRGTTIIIKIPRT